MLRLFRPFSSKTTIANVNRTWSLNQRPKSEAFSGPRFEQTDLEWQPNPKPAIDLINQVPVKFVTERRVACDGGGGALGHPKVWINLDNGIVNACGYCGLRFQRKH